jgi:hypothetical protein
MISQGSDDGCYLGKFFVLSPGTARAVQRATRMPSTTVSDAEDGGGGRGRGRDAQRIEHRESIGQRI